MRSKSRGRGDARSTRVGRHPGTRLPCHFLEGISVYWRDQTILQETRTKKLAKRYTPFSALRSTFERFGASTIVLSYSSNAVPDAATIERLLREVKTDVEVRTIDHRYHFGAHRTAARREATEHLFIGR